MKVDLSKMSVAKKDALLEILLSDDGGTVEDVVAKKPLRVSKKKSKGKKAKLSASQVAWRESAMEEHSEECESVVAEIVAVLEEGEVVLVSNAASSESELVEVAAIFDAGDEVPNPVKDLGWKGRSAPTPFAFCLREMLKAEGVVVKAWVPSMAK